MIIGVLGGGQLARMLALAGHPLGMETVVLCPVEDAAAAAVTTHIHGSLIDRELLEQLADAVDVVTYEFENVPHDSLRLLAGRVPVHPPVEALAAGQDRLAEKRLFRRLGIPTAAFTPVDEPGDLRAAMTAGGFPALLKTRREGYDGKGQVRLDLPTDLEGALERIGGAAAVVESRVEFDRELSIVAVRGRDGSRRFYPVTENVHEEGILRTSICRPGDPMQGRAEDYAGRLLDHLDYVGVLALELFQVGTELLANEFAPRVHNSGHWTIEGAEISQFENHLRAVSGLPLGDTAPVAAAAMVNCIGRLPDAAAVMAVEGAHLHAYGKAPRPGRKVGHVTVRAPDPATLDARLGQVIGLVKAAEGKGP